jgi:hypothetical protein
VKRDKEDNLLHIFEDELSHPTNIGEMMASSSSNIKGNLRGTSSSSAAAAQEEEEEEEDKDIQPNVRKLIEDIEIKESITKANTWLKRLDIEITNNLKEGIDTLVAREIIKEHEQIQHILTAFNNLKTIKLKTHKTLQFKDNISQLKV